ncbi:unnamed protein product [Caenorhabditis angaria]|uniref:CWH43-like N-terminal domain-containing protein n=1 Tax=Caenorhabditis angaria TaxID=860376 RepID=A0A9P1NCN8_9PELO|nr:unnamed protein product [Caenorhabditis angaria]
MLFNSSGIFPFLTVVLTLCAMFSGYGIAVANDHVDAWIPFISDCAAESPEKMVFGELLTLSAFCLAVTMYFIHRNIISFYEEQHVDIGKWAGFSKFILGLGWLAAIGATIVANFPESAQIIVHTIGAFTFFVGITFYFWGLLFISYSLKPKLVPIHLTNFRLLLTITLSLLLIFHIICLTAQPFVQRVNGKLPPRPDWPNHIERPKPGDAYYTNHIAAALSEWIVAIIILIGVLSFSFEFAATKYRAPKFVRQHSIDNHVTVIETPIQHETIAPYFDHYSQTSTLKRLPRVDKVYPTSVYNNSNRLQYY